MEERTFSIKHISSDLPDHYIEQLDAWSTIVVKALTVTAAKFNMPKHLFPCIVLNAFIDIVTILINESDKEMPQENFEKILNDFCEVIKKNGMANFIELQESDAD